jgi:hypothetical protein
MSVYLSAEFPDKHAAARAIEDLKARGLGAEDLHVFSTEPVMFDPGVLDRPSRMSLAVVLGALAFGISAACFIYYTQHDYPLVTGGMPIFSLWAAGVPIYEMTMLGAILTSFGCFLWQSGLLRPDKAPVPKLEPGSICLRVRCAADQAVFFETCLEKTGAETVSRLRAAT